MGRLLDDGALKQQIGTFAKACAGVVIIGDTAQARAVIAALFRDDVSPDHRQTTKLEGRYVEMIGSRLISLIGIEQRRAWPIIAAIRAVALRPTIAVFGDGSESDRIVSLELGADEAVPMLSVLETTAKIRSTLRRIELYALSEPKRFVFSGFQLDLDRRSLLAPDNKTVELTGREFDVLKVFAMRPNRVFSREQVLDLVGAQHDCLDRAIDTCITRLRKKLKRAGAPADVIKTVRGAGYQLVD